MSKKCFRQSVTCKLHCSPDNLKPDHRTTIQTHCLDANPSQSGFARYARLFNRRHQAEHTLHIAPHRLPTGFQSRLSCDNSSTDLLQVWQSISSRLQLARLRRPARASREADHACRLRNTVKPRFDTVSGQSRFHRWGRTRPVASDRLPGHTSGRRHVDRAGRADRIEPAHPALTQTIRICPCTRTLKRDTHHAIA